MSARPIHTGTCEQCTELRTLLLDVIEDYADALPYIGDYYREKWGYDDTLNAARRALGIEFTPWQPATERP